jgi:hypothetical protein
MTEWIDTFYGAAAIDCWTIVLKREPGERYYPMIAADWDGQMFYQHTEGHYDPEGENTHLGQRPRFMPEQLLDRILEEIAHD